jgi:L-threonylcarbamoyladenylate synthase
VAADGDIEKAVEAIRAGLPVLLPTDTVYGLVTSAARDDYTWGLYQLKGRDRMQPTALLAASVDDLFACVPELRDVAAAIITELLPGPYTLVLPNPARRYPWLTGARADAIGVRVADLPEPAARVVAAVCCVTATSANEPGEPSVATLHDVPERIRSACAAELDVGPLTGRPSTVIDFTGAEPVVIRDGAARAADAIARVRRVLAD